MNIQYIWSADPRKKSTKSDAQRHRAWLSVVNIILLLSMEVLIGETAASQTPDRNEPPKPGPTPALILPKIQHMTLSNGLPVLLMEKHTVPLVQINMLIKTGGIMDPPGKNGLANMTAAMLMEGAGPRDALQLADAIDYLGADISAVAGHHTTAVALHSSLATLDSALALLSDIVLRPTFPTAELERKRKERLTALVQWRDEPSALASVIFNRTLYGTQHPYGVPSIGDEKSLRSFRVEDVRNFHSEHYCPNNAALVVVGDVTVEGLLPRLEAAFGSWKPATIAAPALPAIKQLERREVILVDKPGAAQSQIRIGRIGARRLTEDFYALTVMNSLLGGQFTSRLNQNLREQHGYTYGAGSLFDFRPLPGPFFATAAVQTAVTDKALMEFMKELQGILQPVPESELDRAKNYIALGFPGEFQTVAQVTARLEELVLYSLPDDYFNRYVDRILAVESGNVNLVAKKYLDSESTAIIIVGDRKEIEAGVRALNLGPLKIMTVEDVLGKPPSVDDSQ